VLLVAVVVDVVLGRGEGDRRRHVRVLRALKALAKLALTQTWGATSARSA
jgi:hypothetical protein